MEKIGCVANEIYYLPFFSLTAKGELLKFGKGGAGKGPFILPRETSDCNFSSTMDGCCNADCELCEMRDFSTPTKFSRNPDVKPLMMYSR